MPEYSPEQIRRWANEYRNGTIGGNDKLLFEQWLAQRPDAETEFNIPYEKTELENELLNNIGAATFDRRTVKLNRQWIRYAAAIIIIAGIGTYLWLTAGKKEKSLAFVQTDTSTDILPGTNKAVLTLSDGKKVELNSTISETINDGSLSIQNNSGALIYSQTRTSTSGEAFGEAKEDRSARSTVLYNTMTTPRGGQYQLTLSDGTRVWLNATSSIRYPAVFSGSRREVTITGEAYLEVARNKAIPFLVSIPGQSTIEVLGTSFNVNAYENEPATKTTLVDGKIRVITGSQSSLLLPGNQAVIDQNNPAQVIHVQPADIAQSLAWKNGAFNFDKLTVMEAMRQISRWYDVDVKIGNGLENKRFMGSVQRDLTLSELLHVLDGIGAHFKLEGRTITVSR